MELLIKKDIRELPKYSHVFQEKFHKYDRKSLHTRISCMCLGLKIQNKQEFKNFVPAMRWLICPYSEHFVTELL